MTHHTFTIGVLGGLGPLATVEFEHRLVRAFHGGDQAIPRIVTVNDGSVADRTAFLLSGGDDPLDGLISGGKLLWLAGADVVCVPCNAVHAGRILSRLQAIVPLPYIDMPAAAISRAEHSKAERTLVLATSGTRTARIYDDRAVRTRIEYPSDVGQALVDSLVVQLKRTEGDKKLMGRELAKLVDNSGCGAAILACTELSLVRDDVDTLCPLTDAMDELVSRCRALHERYHNLDRIRPTRR